MRFILLILGALLLCVPAYADLIVPNPIGGGCRTWTLCDVQATGTTCVNADTTTENYLNAGAEYTWTAFGQSSDSTTAYTVKLYSTSPGQGYHATKRALINASGDITYANPMFSWAGIMGDIHAVLGGTLTGGVTVILKGCTLTRP